MSGEIHHCETLHCALTLDKAGLRAAFNNGASSGRAGDIRNVLPESMPLDKYVAGDEWLVTPKAFDGDGVIDLNQFTWCGGPGSGSINALIRFARLTKGTAEFVLITEEGHFLGYMIREGKLYRRNVVLTTQAIKHRGKTHE